MQGTTRIRSAVPLDLEEITRGEQLARRGHGEIGLGSDPALLDDMVWSGRYLVAVQGLRPVAGVGWTVDDDGAAALEGFFVHPEHAGQGLGLALLRAAEAAAMAQGHSLAGEVVGASPSSSRSAPLPLAA